MRMLEIVRVHVTACSLHPPHPRQLHQHMNLQISVVLGTMNRLAITCLTQITLATLTRLYANQTAVDRGLVTIDLGRSNSRLGLC